MKIESVILTLVFEDDANLGMLDEYVNTLETTLSPIFRA
jgi:hypothetical protein